MFLAMEGDNVRPEIDPITETDPKTESGRLRLVTHGKDTYRIECHDPYGHWTIRVTKGITPSVLADQTFTQASIAEKALEIFVNTKKE